jgi:hypothetical protein
MVMMLVMGRRFAGKERIARGGWLCRGCWGEGQLMRAAAG